MEHGAKRRCEIWDVGFETGETGIRGQRSDVRGQGYDCSLISYF